ncbi:MAG: class I SAM-dependent methyltransferase [Thermoanaerobaculaceae bacterium]|nr:class I SAM-dependent methyltransferase [Thermoanaerobaculaceae bacterium]
MIKDHYDVIRKNKIAFWWFLGRRDLFKKILGKEIKTKVAMGVDIGCGPATNESLYPYFSDNWISLDHSKKSFEDWEKNGSLPLIADIISIPLKVKSADLCFLLDVLEHLENESKALQEINKIIKNGGYLLISVPAFKILWSFHDEQAGHKKRYRGKELERISEENGFEVVRSLYFNSFLFLPILIIRKILRISSKGKNTLEINLSPKFLDKVLYLILKIENFINLNIIKIPFGTSFVVLLRKK